MAPDGSPVELYLRLPSFGELTFAGLAFGEWLDDRRTWFAARRAS